MSLQYWQKLQDPRWQRKRLEVLQRDHFTCRQCGDETRRLDVHHEYYVSQRQPWEYPLSAYKTLCSECHKEIKETPAQQVSGVPDWELYQEIEQESELHAGCPTGFMQDLMAFSDRIHEPRSKILALIGQAMRFQIIDKESLTVWRSEVKSARNEGACQS